MKYYTIKKALICTIIFSLTACNMFEKQEKLLQTLNNSDGKTIKFYAVDLGATTNDVIQVRKVNKDNTETLIHAYEHNLLKGARFITNDSLVIIFSDTTIYGPSKRADTVGIMIR